MDVRKKQNKNKSSNVVVLLCYSSSPRFRGFPLSLCRFALFVIGCSASSADLRGPSDRQFASDLGVLSASGKSGLKSCSVNSAVVWHYPFLVPVNNKILPPPVTMLSETIPVLMKKLDKLQNHSAQMPNISENINRIRQLIEQARRAASKVHAHAHAHKNTHIIHMFHTHINFPWNYPQKTYVLFMFLSFYCFMVLFLTMYPCEALCDLAL